jgi:hypothetical protein
MSQIKVSYRSGIDSMVVYDLSLDRWLSPLEVWVCLAPMSRYVLDITFSLSLPVTCVGDFMW